MLIWKLYETIIIDRPNMEVSLLSFLGSPSFYPVVMEWMTMT